jgi:hypothetical protein
MRFLDEYQKLVLTEPESAVPHELKETLLTLRQATDSIEVETSIDRNIEMTPDGEVF